MVIVWKGLKVTAAYLAILSLLTASGWMLLLLYGQYKEWSLRSSTAIFADVDKVKTVSTSYPSPAPSTAPRAVISNTPVHIDSPQIKQNPELPSGCEVTSLTMLLQFAGVNKSKMELFMEMPKDTTPIVWNIDGSIQYWGNPNNGYVGDPTGRAKGFGIYHTALFPLLSKYVPTAVDLTGKSFGDIEKSLRGGIPVVAWTTIEFVPPRKWVEWDTPIGAIRTTFEEHAVLLVGLDDASVYINDPLSGLKNNKINKEQFITSWEAMGKQAITYTKAK